MVSMTLKLNPNNPLVIGLTGGIGSGKSFVLNLFKSAGFCTFNYDTVVHELLASGSEVFNEILAHFPDVLVDDKISRELLGRQVFSSPQKLTILESILHPAARKLEYSFVAENKKLGKASIVEVPLLLEKHREKDFDIIVVTDSPLDTRRIRVLKRGGMSEQKLDSIIRQQVSDEYRKLKADIIIDTSYDEAHTIIQFKDLIDV